MKYLITGGCGFIGGHLSDELCRQGHEVLILDDLSSGSLDVKPDDAAFIHGDVTDPIAVATAVDMVDGCFHLAAVASVERCTLDWVGSHRTNLTGTITVLEAAKRGSKPVVFASSAAVYGQCCIGQLSETGKTEPVSAYGADKLGCEHHGRAASLIHGVPNRALRFFNVYGPRQNPLSPYSGVITIFGQRLQQGQPLTINGDGSIVRDFIYVADVVTGLITAMQHCVEQRGFDVFNICTGVATSVSELATTMCTLFDGGEVCFGPPRPGDPNSSIGNPLKAKGALGFLSAVTLSSGLCKTFAR